MIIIIFFIPASKREGRVSGIHYHSTTSLQHHNTTPPPATPFSSPFPPPPSKANPSPNHDARTPCVATQKKTKERRIPGSFTRFRLGRQVQLGTLVRRGQVPKQRRGKGKGEGTVERGRDKEGIRKGKGRDGHEKGGKVIKGK